MLSEAKTVYREAREAHARAYRAIVELQRGVASSGNIQELTDAIYSLRETAGLLDDARKEASKLMELLMVRCCALWTATDGSPIRTEYCIGSPDIKKNVKVPKGGTADYDAFCKHFGVDPKIPFRPHWPEMLERISADIAAGKPCPPGCDPAEMVTKFVVSVRKKRPILDETEAPVVHHVEVLPEMYKVLDAISAVNVDALNALFLAIGAYQDVLVDEANMEADDETESLEAETETEATPF